MVRTDSGRGVCGKDGLTPKCCERWGQIRPCIRHQRCNGSRRSSKPARSTPCPRGSSPGNSTSPATCSPSPRGHRKPWWSESNEILQSKTISHLPPSVCASLCPFFLDPSLYLSIHPTNIIIYIYIFDGVARLVQRRGLQVERPQVRTPSASGAQENIVSFVLVKNVVLTRCRCAQPPVCIRTHKNDHVRTLKIM